MSDRLENKIVFCLANTPDGVPLVTVGIPKGAWDYMKNGKTHHFDLSSVGVPVRLMLFGADTHDDAMKVIEQSAKQNGIALLDERRRDFSIKDAPRN